MAAKEKNINIFETSYGYDKKHKVNTSSSKVSDNVLNEIETKGVSLERLNELSKQGIDIYKYRTQITIHGQFSELSNQYLGYYQCLIQNKNKSIGIKWNAVDFEKKSKIYSAMQNCDYTIEKKSNLWVARKMKSVKNIDEAVEYSTKYMDIVKRIEKNIFYGTANCYAMNIPYYGMFVVLEIDINAVLEKNLEKLFTQITEKTFAEVEAEAEVRRLEREARYKKEREAREIEAKKEAQKRLEFAQGMDNITAVTNFEIQEGTIECEIIKTYDGEIIARYYHYSKPTKRSKLWERAQYDIETKKVDWCKTKVQKTHIRKGYIVNQ